LRGPSRWSEKGRRELRAECGRQAHPCGWAVRLDHLADEIAVTEEAFGAADHTLSSAEARFAYARLRVTTR